MSTSSRNANISTSIKNKSSRKDALKKMAALTEISMEHLSEEEKDKRVRNFSKRVDEVTSVRAKS